MKDRNGKTLKPNQVVYVHRKTAGMPENEINDDREFMKLPQIGLVEDFTSEDCLVITKEDETYSWQFNGADLEVIGEL